MERATRAVWAKRVERWKDSGLTAKEFAAETNVSPQSLSFWRWKLKREGSGSASTSVSRRRRTPAPAEPSASSFVRLVPSTSIKPAKPAEMLELVLASGVIVRVPPRFDEATLARLMTVLGGRR